MPASGRQTAVTSRSASGTLRRPRWPEGAAPPPSRADFAPHRQLSSHQRGALRHAAQSVVSLDALAGEHRRIDPLAVVTDPQAEFLVVVPDVGLDHAPPARGGTRSAAPPPRPCRSRHERSGAGPAPAPRRPPGTWAVGRRSRRLASSSPKALMATARSSRSTADVRRPCTASRPSVIAFAACSIARLQLLLGLCRALRQQVREPSGTAAAARGSSEAECREAPGRSACARRRAPRASCRTRAAPDASGAGTPPPGAPATSAADEARNQVVFHQGGVITIGSDTPSSFQTPSLFDPCTRNT